MSARSPAGQVQTTSRVGNHNTKNKVNQETMINLPYQPTAVIATKSQPPFVGSNDHQQQHLTAKQDSSSSQKNTGMVASKTDVGTGTNIILDNVIQATGESIATSNGMVVRQSAAAAVNQATTTAVHHNVHLSSRTENVLKGFTKGPMSMSFVTLPVNSIENDQSKASQPNTDDSLTNKSSVNINTDNNARDSSLQTVVQGAAMKSAYPAVVALPVHHGTGSVLPTTILNELSASPPGTSNILNELSGSFSGDNDKVATENKDMKAGDDGSNSPSVSILERALTEVFPGTDGQQEQKSSQDLNVVADTKLIEHEQSTGHSGEVLQVQSDSGEGQVVAQSANFGYPGNYLFPSNIEATMEKVQVATDAIRDIIGLTS